MPNITDALLSRTKVTGEAIEIKFIKKVRDVGNSVSLELRGKRARDFSRLNPSLRHDVDLQCTGG
jgi:hypothetical protein